MLGWAIRKCRQSRHLSQGELAKRCHVARETINRIEAGRVIPNVKLLGEIASALDMKGSDLLRMAEDEESISDPQTNH